jgi:pectate lyase
MMRYLRIRSGAHGSPGKGQINICLDPLPAQENRYGDVFNIMLDHVSVSWSLDENIAIFRNVPGDTPAERESFPKIHNVTVQRCIIAEGLYPHSTGIQMGGERVMRDGLSVFNGGHGVFDVDIHHNLFANTSHRNPGLGSKSARVVNNVMYNWSSKCGETHDAISVDWIANWFQPGPLSTPGRLLVHNDFFKGRAQNRFEPPSIYMAGNVNASVPSQSDWEMYEIHYENRALPSSYRRSSPMSDATISLSLTNAEEAYQSILGNAGANARLNALGEWLPNADAVDVRVLEDVRLKRGNGVQSNGSWTHYTNPDQVGGYPKLEPGSPYTDNDVDGMSDEWEKRHGLDATDPSDGSTDADDDGYTNVEEFLNGTKPKVKEAR